MKIALVYDALQTRHGGAEYVLEAMLKTWPDAEVYTSVWDKSQASWVLERLKKPHTTWVQRIPRISRSTVWSGLFRPLAFESLDLDRYDVVISVTSGEAKGVLTKPHQTHICYLLTPQRYLYANQELYLNQISSSIPVLNRVVKAVARVYLAYLRWWDQAAQWRPDVYIPISRLVKNRAELAYPEAHVSRPLYPPIKPVRSLISEDHSPLSWSEYLLFVGRLKWYKHPLEIVAVALERQERLVLIGAGESRRALHKKFGSQIYYKPGESLATAMQTATKQSRPIILYSDASDSELAAAYQAARCIVMPGIDDFGLTALESLSVGTPVVINRESGAAELIRDGIDGVHITGSTAAEIAAGIDTLSGLSIDPKKLQQQATQCSTEAFIGQLTKTVYDVHIRKEV